MDFMLCKRSYDTIYQVSLNTFQIYSLLPTGNQMLLPLVVIFCQIQLYSVQNTIFSWPSLN